MGEDIFQKNLKAMEKWYPEFADEIRKRDDGELEPELKIEIEKSWDSEVIFRVHRGGRTLYLNGKRNVKKPLEMWLEHLGDIRDYAPVILLGGGSGLYLKQLVRNTSDKVNVMLYEPSFKIFLNMLKSVDLSEEIESRPIGFVVEGVNENEFEPVVSKLVSVETMEFLKQETHPNYRQLFPEKILKALRYVEKDVAGILTNLNTSIKFSGFLARNQMENMKYVCDGYHTKKLFSALPHDIPAILVSAGPSLNKNIKDLKKAKNKAFILAVDTAVKPLVREGIIPDAFITIDARKSPMLVDVDEIRDVPVIAPVTANYDILKEQRGKKIFYYDGYVLPFMAYLATGKFLPEVATGGSVACSGFSLLHKMGFSTVILVGQDLAFTDNKSHADGTFQDKMPEKDTRGFTRVKGNYEDELPTPRDFKLYLDWFNMYIEEIKKRTNIRVINATAGGAYINNTELMTLEEAILETCGREVDLASCIEKMESEFNAEERKQVVEYLHTVPDDLDGIRKNAKALYATYRKIANMCRSGHIEKNSYLKLLKKVKKQTKKCEGTPVYQLISSTMPGAEFIVQSESLYQADDLEEGGKAVATQGMRYAKMLQECAGILYEYAREVLLPIE